MIKFLGQASFVIQTDKTVLVDPWFSETGAYLNSWFQFPKNSNCVYGWIKDLDYVVISHEHEDHMDINFLKTLSKNVKILIPEYKNSRMFTILKKHLKNNIIQVKDKTTLEITDDIKFTPVIQSIPGWDDCTLIFETDDGTIIDVNDMKITDNDISWIKERFDSTYLFIQYSGASWYPIVYPYSDEKKRKIIDKKVYTKFNNVLNITRQLDPTFMIPCAGPPCFLNDDHFYLNFGDLPPFPDQKYFYEWIPDRGIKDKTLILLPDDEVWSTMDQKLNNKVSLNRPCFVNKESYLKQYKQERQKVLHRKDESIEDFDFFFHIDKYFTPLIRSSLFFRKKINGAILLKIHGETSLTIRVDFRNAKIPVQVYDESNESHDYFYSFAIRDAYIFMILNNTLTWENWLLSLRCKIFRNPDKYNEFLTVFLKFADPLKFKDYEKYYNHTKFEETVKIDYQGKSYMVQRFCPHAMGDLSKGKIIDDKIICPLHAWEFNLEDGNCVNHSSEIYVQVINE